MKIYSFYNNKGGVGKTTTCHQFAQNLSSQGKKVLVIDMDPQGNITSRFTENRDLLEYTSYELLVDNEVSLKDCVNQYNENIDYIGNNLKMQNTNTEILLKTAEANPSLRLKNKLINTDINYDFILIDCPPTMDLLVNNALVITDEVIIPIMADGYSILGIEMLIKKIEAVKLEYNANLKIGGVFLNGYRNTKLHNEVYEVFNNIFDKMCSTKVKQYVLIQENSHTTDLITENVRSKKVIDMYKDLVTEITGGIE